MSSVPASPTASFERTTNKSSPVPKNGAADPNPAVTEGTDAIETPETSVVDESRTPNAKPVHTWGRLEPVSEKDISMLQDGTSTAASDAGPTETEPRTSIQGHSSESVHFNADDKSKSGSVKSKSVDEKPVVCSKDTEVDATGPTRDAGSTDSATDAGAVCESEVTDKIDKIETQDDGKFTTTMLSSFHSILANSQSTVPNEQDAAAPSPAKAFFTDDIRSRGLDTIHEHGSVNLKLGEYTDLFVQVKGPDGRVHAFEVQSDVLAAASTEFHKMVYDTHKRGNKAEWKAKWVWELADSAIGLKVLFCLLHHKYVAALFTQEPQPQQVYDVLRTFSKYAIKDEAYHPMAKSWIAGFRKGLAHTNLTQLERLYVAYKLGDFKSLKVCLRKVAHTVEVGEGDVLVVEGKNIQDVVPINDELVANIRAVRSVDLKKLMEPLQKARDSLMGETDDGADYCKSTTGHDECNEKILGSLLFSLRRQGLVPIPIPAEYTGTVSVLAVKVSEMDIRGLYVPMLTPTRQLHSLCKLSQDKVAKDILGCKTYLPLYDNLVEHMVLSVRRCGIARQEKGEFEDYKTVFNAASTKYKEDFRQDFWGWDEGAESVGSHALFPTEDDSGIGEGATKIWRETVPFQ